MRRRIAARLLRATVPIELRAPSPATGGCPYNLPRCSRRASRSSLGDRYSGSFEVRTLDGRESSAMASFVPSRTRLFDPAYLHRLTYADGALRLDRLCHPVADIKATGIFPMTISFRTGAHQQRRPWKATRDNTSPATHYGFDATGDLSVLRWPRECGRQRNSLVAAIDGAISLSRGELRVRGVQSITGLAVRVRLRRRRDAADVAGADRTTRIVVAPDWRAAPPLGRLQHVDARDCALRSIPDSTALGAT